jgi:hypothetical protein
MVERAWRGPLSGAKIKVIRRFKATLPFFMRLGQFF